MLTATPARIRRVRREAEYARSTQPAVLTARPNAKDGYANPMEGFFDTVAQAQLMLTERANVLMADRKREAVETTEPFRLGSTLPLTPSLPRVRLIDQQTEFDRTMMVRGVAIDLAVDRNAIEVVG